MATFQGKATNTAQIQSLLACVSDVVGGREALILELGAGKALLARGLYEAFDRKLPVVALDSRVVCEADSFYDPPECGAGDAGYTRMVADVREVSWSDDIDGERPIVAVTKHLCGGATDVALRSVCSLRVEGVCMAPCCHQKTALKDYSHRGYLESIGLGASREFSWLTNLIQMSRHTELKDFEYQSRNILRMLPFSEVRALGRQARRVIEEGRVRYLRENGFEADVLRYVAEDVTPDNLVIVARRVTAGPIATDG